MTDLSGQHAIVTGGGTGVGAAIARVLAEAGAVATLAGRRAEPIEALATQLPGAQAIRCDFGDEIQVAQLFEQAANALGPAGIVVANAGAAESAPMTKTTLESWQRTIATNLTGAFLTARAALPALRAARGGRLIFIASTAGLKGYPYVAPYCAAKHGVVGLVRALAQETALDVLTVNAVCPGFVDTPMLEKSIANIVEKTGRSAKEARNDLMRFDPQGRFITPEEVAVTVLWLCSPSASSITGQAISISGGEV